MSNGNELDPFFGEDAAMGGAQQEEPVLPITEPVAPAETLEEVVDTGNDVDIAPDVAPNEDLLEEDHWR